jgi:hypothetical protein
VLGNGHFVSPDWDYSFIYQDVKTEYNFVTCIPEDVSFVRMQGDFEYLLSGASHHAAKVFKVPHPALNTDPQQASLPQAG